MNISLPIIEIRQSLIVQPLMIWLLGCETRSKGVEILRTYKRSTQEFADSSDGTTWRREPSDEIHRGLATSFGVGRTEMAIGEVVKNSGERLFVDFHQDLTL